MMSDQSRTQRGDAIREITRLLPRIYKRYRASYARRIQGHGITVRGALLLRAVAILPEATVGSVAREMAVTPSTASIVLSGLERKGFVRRRYRVLGRSRTALELTPAGQRTLSALRTSIGPDSLPAALRRLAPSERSMLLESLRRLDAVETSQERRNS
ncbi:MAG: winged helix-turn-helix transcriptional regulator [Candidatus Eremiobacteraeota bacterium]|nr:winged helix-turn-helix transcriptional regulator [Candidatus Eremiobacteraeota bacterium]MBV8222045.1 winged helix-turn-helix transcriptional regulator [Candidatus Eremiobacteraeota bacterium]